jgi:hypothetical protein
MYYENTGGEKGLTTFDYHHNGPLNMAVWELLDGTRNSINFYTHDDQGCLIRKYREFSDDITSTEYYTYNEQARIVREHFERSDSVSGTAVYEYDNSGLLKTMRCLNYKGWFTGDIGYTCDANGVKLRASITRDGNEIGTIRYDYDENGNLMKEHWDFLGKWSQTFSYEYECSPETPLKKYSSSNVFLQLNPNARVIREYYDYADETEGPSNYTYNDMGKLLKKRFERSDGLTTETFYLYNGLGNLTKSYRKYSNGLTAVFSYAFTKDGNLKERSFKRDDGKNGFESYKYDEDGKLKSARYVNVDACVVPP